MRLKSLPKLYEIDLINLNSTHKSIEPFFFILTTRKSSIDVIQKVCLKLMRSCKTSKYLHLDRCEVKSSTFLSFVIIHFVLYLCESSPPAHARPAKFCIRVELEKLIFPHSLSPLWIFCIRLQ